MSTDTIIEVEGLSKQYRLGEVSTGSLGHDINRAWHKLRGKPDPYIKVTHANDRTQAVANDEEFVWALEDINFEVKRGEVLGIIGRNGAGKSTLLKILSRVTAPTTGEVRVDGRIASLLEVGTGFHQDLTGRENIYLNGAILGMKKTEITSKLDEIVDFSGCARYLDTPVKRYSSGMVVRLGFAVAAHLEPDILVVDEVLAGPGINRCRRGDGRGAAVPGIVARDRDAELGAGRGDCVRVRECVGVDASAGDYNVVAASCVDSERFRRRIRRRNCAGCACDRDGFAGCGSCCE